MTDLGNMKANIHDRQGNLTHTSMIGQGKTKETLRHASMIDQGETKAYIHDRSGEHQGIHP